MSLCFAFPADSVSPEWLKLLPAGDVAGRDGRQWKNSQPDAVISAFKRNGIPLPFDFGHSTELKAPKGEKAPAAGWINELENRNGEIWGKADWNSSGLAALKNKEYKFCSPAFLHDNKNTVIAFSSFGMT
ncbi:MAG: peptidase, partial [Gammaproteobacteria bacterium]|nr:peptidase [Gammaproteobacteria bacterium]